MFVKPPLLLSVALVVAASAVHSQSVNPVVSFEPRSASLAPIAPAGPTTPTAPNTETGRNQASERSSIAETMSSQPWGLALPKLPGGESIADPDKLSSQVDLSALRYFAGQNDLARVAAEIRLLRAKYPGWEPPEDLFIEVNNGESEKPLWELFAKHDLVGLKAAIEETRQSKPGWQPSTDLANKLVLAEAHDDLVAASDASQWGAVIDIAAANKMLMTCNDIDALWRTAEALVRTDDEPRALEAYRYILATCSKPEERLATVQKASLLLKAPEELESLIRMGKRLSDGKSEFESVRLDLIRQRIGDAAAGKPGVEINQGDVATLTAHARSAVDRNDEELLGWYAYSRKSFAEAEKWFRAALQLGPEAKAAEGLVLTLREGGNIQEAQKLALQYAPLDRANRKLMVDLLTASIDDSKSAPLSVGDLAMLVKAIDTEQSFEGAQVYGWHLYRVNDLAGAQNWFRKSIEWQPNESSAIGLLVTASRLKHTREYEDLAEKYRGTYSKIAELDALLGNRARSSHVSAGGSRAKRVVGSRDGGWDRSADAIVKIYEGGNYDQALTMLEQRKQRKRSEPAGLSVVRAWAMYHKGDWEGAKQVFATAESKGLTREGQEGLQIIQRSYLPPVFR
jgi:cellulose synthase operon protein C